MKLPSKVEWVMLAEEREQIIEIVFYLKEISC